MATYKGNVKESQRAAQLMKQREKERQEIEFQKKKLESELRVGEFSSKFAVHYDAIESQLKTDTVGLVTLDEMKARQQAFITQREKELALGKAGGAKSRDGRSLLGRQGTLHKGPVSFCPDADEAEEDDDGDNDTSATATAVDVPARAASPEKKSNSPPSTEEVTVQPASESSSDQHPDNDDSSEEKTPKKRRRLGKNPNVDTSFLPDIDRDEEEKQLRDELRREWHAKQTAIKEEEIAITYSYWDGSGHRRQVKMKKGHSIHLFLHRCLDQLRKDFSELKSATADQMMYIKEDLIIPHHYTFYDFIVSKARGKSGPLFTFDVYDDVRLRMDAKVEKEESHAGKVCLRSWYERHKHIFPASRWEPYDPAKNWDQYTISDKMSAKIVVR
ncbi:unnamed protein product [Schistocephalus solidus]|uniref:Protein FAM50 homolog n=1 Tax=Schistocephalus solidus TaxID=70667 RepID=A0A183SJ49_SCHSO|nr:unnamed protein product [Schistocephalus solidus]